MYKYKTQIARFIVVSLSVFIISFSLNGQDDLSLPGDEAPVVVDTAATDTSKSGGDSKAGASPGSESLIDMVVAGGWAMIPLFVMLFAIIALSVYLMLDLKKSNFLPPVLVNNLKNCADSGDFQGIQTNTDQNPSCLGQVMKGATDYIVDRGYQVLDSDSIYDQMADASRDFNRRRVNLMNYLSVISQAAPMVGLLGTVSGMIKAFQTLNQSGMGDPGALAGNISEALVTTASGLIVALPAIFAYFFFRDKLVGLISEVDKQGASILSSLRRVVIPQQY